LSHYFGDEEGDGVLRLLGDEENEENKRGDAMLSLMFLKVVEVVATEANDEDPTAILTRREPTDEHALLLSSAIFHFSSLLSNEPN